MVTIISCGPTDKSSYLPGYSGQVGEVIVVCSKQSWNGELGNQIKSVLSAPKYGLPQEEPKFSAIQVSKASFNRVLNTHRNILQITISDTVSKEGLKFIKSKYAKGQMFVELKAKNYSEAIAVIQKNNAGIVSLFQRSELNRLISKNKKLGPKAVNKKVEKLLGVKINLQKGFEIRVEKPGFIWLRLQRERPVGGFQHQIDQNIIVTETDYYERTQFLDSLLNKERDIIFKNIPGPSKNSFVITDYEYVPPVFTEIEINNTYGKNVQGLWKMENNFMGGPFVGISFVHPTKDKIISIYGFVFAPQFNKIEYLREVEAILRSTTF